MNVQNRILYGNNCKVINYKFKIMIKYYYKKYVNIVLYSIVINYLIFY